MKKDNCCVFALVMAVVAIVFVSFFGGYLFTEWDTASWLAALVVVIAAFICMRCRQSEDKEDQDG